MKRFLVVGLGNRFPADPSAELNLVPVDRVVYRDRVVDRPVDRIVEKRVEVPVDRYGRVDPDDVEAAVDTVLDVRDVYLDAAMEALRTEFGSVLRYLETAAGVDARRIDRLRNDLLV